MQSVQPVVDAKTLERLMGNLILKPKIVNAIWVVVKQLEAGFRRGICPALLVRVNFCVEGSDRYRSCADCVLKVSNGDVV